MNSHHDNVDNTRAGHEGEEQLVRQLRGLRQDAQPGNDLWPGIAARLAPHSPQTGTSTLPVRRVDRADTRRRRGIRRLAPFALAASLLLALGVAWQQRPELSATPGESTGLIARQADAMTREYEGALRELQSAAPQSARTSDALRQLDTSAAQIRDALAQDPDARFLLDRLRRTYEKRLEITQRNILA